MGYSPGDAASRTTVSPHATVREYARPALSFLKRQRTPTYQRKTGQPARKQLKAGRREPRTLHPSRAQSVSPPWSATAFLGFLRAGGALPELEEEEDELPEVPVSSAPCRTSGACTLKQSCNGTARSRQVARCCPTLRTSCHAHRGPSSSCLLDVSCDASLALSCRRQPPMGHRRPPVPWRRRPQLPLPRRPSLPRRRPWA